MATKEEAIHRVTSAGFSHRVATAVVEDIGATAVFNGMPERENAGSARKFVMAHGYSQEAADRIIEKSGAHIINTVASLSSHTPEEEKHPLWDPPLKAAAAAK